MSQLSDWKPSHSPGGRSWQRLDEEGRTGAMVNAPGSKADRWGWFAMVPSGASRGGKAANRRKAMRRANRALLELEAEKPEHRPDTSFRYTPHYPSQRHVLPLPPTREARLDVAVDLEQSPRRARRTLARFMIRGRRFDSFNGRVP